ncbi:hypothetical protein VTP01DRAFT_911, partial [Rhizomucor pusillus]|uniref:uncharacterized protein n=1 Tax=Rhizomucor pusillus TaxID=4840 RepID=UPI0037430123
MLEAPSLIYKKHSIKKFDSHELRLSIPQETEKRCADHEWRYNRIPDYTKVNEYYEKEKTKNHPEGSLEWLVSNLVKNWEKEMSYKLRADQIRTINSEKYRFSVNGQKWHNIEEMLKIGTYNALIGDTELYKASESDFADSHKLFKRALRAFSWEVLEVYSGPPTVTFKWRGCIHQAGFPNRTAMQLETYYDPNILIREMTKNRKGNNSQSTSGCPFAS